MNNLLRWDRIVFTVLLVLVWASACAGQGWQPLRPVTATAKLADGVELTAGPAKVRVTVFREGVVRVRVATNGKFAKDVSWAVVESPEPPAVLVEDQGDRVILTCAKTQVTIGKSPLLIRFTDGRGSDVVADEDSLPMAWNGNRFRVWKKLRENESFYGLGDKAGPMNRRGRSFSMWNTDRPGWGETSDPLYITVPFFISLRSGHAYGIFLDNTYRSSFDFGVESSSDYSFGADDGELNYYYFAGPDPQTVVAAYSALVGGSVLPPLWGFGYQQSRWTYTPEARVEEVAARLRRDRIPADAIYLDIDYQMGLAPFTINRSTFPQFEEMVGDLKRNGFHTVLITDLHIKYAPNTGYQALDSGLRDDVFVKRSDGTLYIAPVWPGDSVFPDFTLTRARKWWGEQYSEFVKAGVAGFWNDMDEPSVFVPAKTMPSDNLHRLDDGTATNHAEIHNVYGMLNSRATYEGVLKLRPGERPFVLTRASYAGGARYAATWTGDNSASWNHLGMTVPNLLSLGISGFPFAGADVGGFGGTPDAALLTRWFEAAALQPLFRSHAEINTGPHEPWADGAEQEAIRRKFIELRYRLLPYIYTQFEHTARTGIPMMRPVFLNYPDEQKFYEDDRDFLLGDDFFVAPVVKESLDPERIEFPNGAWFDYWSGLPVPMDKALELRPRVDELPLFVRAGAIVPEQPLVQYTDETPIGPLELRVYPGNECRGELYEDDGHSLDYRNGSFLRVQYSCEQDERRIEVVSKILTNNFTPWWRRLSVQVFGLRAKPQEIRVDGRPETVWKFDDLTKSAIIEIPEARREWKIDITR
jgi:alpha-glucosidase